MTRAVASPVHGCDPGGWGLDLVRDGIALADICYWCDGADPVTPFAVHELQRYVERLSGVRLRALPVAPPAMASSRGIVLASRAARLVRPPGDPGARATLPAEWLFSAQTLLGDSDGDSYVVQTVGDRAAALLSVSSRGLLYAAYEVLQRLGVRFYAPNFVAYEENAEHVPELATVRLGEYHVLEQPSFALRRKYVEEGWSHTPRELCRLVDWMAKVRLNVLVHPYDYFGEGLVRWDDVRDDVLPALSSRGVLLEVGGHGYESFLPPARHPEHYTASTPVFDLDDDAAVDAYAAKVVEYLCTRPEVAVFDAWPPDNGAWPPAAVERFGSVANAHSHITNAVVRAVARAGLEVRIEALSYLRHLEPPTIDHPLDRAVIVDLAPYDRSYAALIHDDHTPANVAYRELAKDWRGQTGGDLGLYEYYRKYSWHSLPIVMTDLISAEIPYYASLGFTGVGIYSEPDDWMPYELVHLLVARLSWDIGMDVPAWLTAYLTDRYVRAAPQLAGYLQEVELAGRALFDRPGGNYQSLAAVEAARRHFSKAARHLHDAATTETAPGPSFVIGRLLANAAYALADTDIDYYRLHDDAAGVRGALVRTRTLLESLRGCGVVLDSVWTRRRLDPAASREATRWLYASYRSAPAGRAPLVGSE